MIYFDNAATGGQKPTEVIESAIFAMKNLLVNPGRSAHDLAIKGEEFVYKTRKQIASFFNLDTPSQVIFTKNCTEALNVAIFGILKRGDHVITTTFEHNSVLRPLYHLESKGFISLTIVKPTKNNFITATCIKPHITPKTKLVCVTSASNVTGEINDYEAIGALLSKKGILFLVDGAQGAGHIYLDLKRQNINILCFSGHKGMDAIQGVGCLLFDKNVKIKPLTFGGSGSESFAKVPSGYPELLESGTLNLPAIISLGEGVLYNQKFIENKQKHLLYLTNYLIEKIKNINGITLYSRRNPVGIVSFSYKDCFSQEIAGVLSSKYDIAVRGGFHCAPKTHEFLKTQTNGLTRVSFSQYNTTSEIDHLVFALENLHKHVY